jgi:hypothetical protein
MHHTPMEEHDYASELLLIVFYEVRSELLRRSVFSPIVPAALALEPVLVLLAWGMVAPWRKTLLKSTSFRLASLRLLPDRLTLLRLAPLRSALLRSASSKKAPRR